MMRRIAALTVIVLLSAGDASAGPIVPRDIGADAKWFGHADVDAIRSLKLVQDLKDQSPFQQQWQAKVQELSQNLGMVPIEDVLGVTVYSDRYDGQTGVGLIYVKRVDRQKMASVLKERRPDCQTSQYGGRALYTWKATLQGKKMELTGAFASDTLIAIGSGAEQAKAALDVLDGKRPGLAMGAALLQGISATAPVACRALDVTGQYRKTTRCPVLQNCQAATLAGTERDGAIVSRCDAVATSKETALKLKVVVDGLKALGEVRFSGVPAIRKVIGALKVETKGASFTATFQASTADVEAAAKALMEQKKKSSFFDKLHIPKKKHDEKQK
jgi:hypothetical protein